MLGKISNAQPKDAEILHDVSMYDYINMLRKKADIIKHGVHSLFTSSANQFNATMEVIYKLFNVTSWSIQRWPPPSLLKYYA